MTTSAGATIIELQKLIIALSRADDSEAEMDVAIAKTQGWVENPTGKRVRQFLQSPNGTIGEAPRYTSNLDVAFQLLNDAIKEWEGGFSWTPGKGGARVNNNPDLEATTPARAICMQALLIHLRRLQNDNSENSSEVLTPANAVRSG